MDYELKAVREAKNKLQEIIKNNNITGVISLGIGKINDELVLMLSMGTYDDIDKLPAFVNDVKVIVTTMDYPEFL